MAKTSSVKDVIVQALAKNRKDSESDRKSPEDYVLVEEIDVLDRLVLHAIKPPIYLYLIFLNLYLTKLIFELDFLSILNLIFAGYTGSKNQVWNKQKIKLKIHFREIQISKIK